MKKTLMASAVGAVIAFGAQSAMAAAPADWSSVAATDVTLFYPGVSPVEWITKGTEHARRCAGCHSEEAGDMGAKMASGQKLEPSPIAGKAPFINARSRPPMTARTSTCASPGSSRPPPARHRWMPPTR